MSGGRGAVPGVASRVSGVHKALFSVVSYKQAKVTVIKESLP